MNKKAIIVSGGFIDEAFALQVFEEIQSQYILGVDRGLAFLYKNQIVPTHILGDFESVPPHIIEYYKTKTDIPILELQPEKNATDTELALRLAIELGVEEMVILGATGTRFDHVMANIQVLKIAQDAGVKAYILDPCNRISLIEKHVCIKKREAYGKYFSIFPLGGSVENLSIRGGKYPLEGYTVNPYDSRCVSNEWEEEIVEIDFDDGIVILMETRDK